MWQNFLTHNFKVNEFGWAEGLTARAIGVVHKGRRMKEGRGVGSMWTDLDTGGGVSGKADVRKNNNYLLIAVAYLFVDKNRYSWIVSNF